MTSHMVPEIVKLLRLIHYPIKRRADRPETCAYDNHRWPCADEAMCRWIESWLP